MTIPFQDLYATNDGVLDEFVEELRGLFEAGHLVEGPSIQKFEEAFAKFNGNRHTIGLGSSSDPLTLALRALNVGPNHEVIVPAFAPVSTADAVARLGAQVVFVDVRPDTYTLDPDQALAKMTSRTKAIVPVHTFGHAAEIERIVTIARTYSVSVVEDTREATGARNGSRRLGTYGEFAAHAFSPSSPLGGLNDCGAITTNNDEGAATLRKLREHGRNSHGEYEMIGYGSRLDPVNAALLLNKLQDVDEFNAERIENARLYNKMFAVTPVQTPLFSDNGNFIYSSYAVAVSNRDQLADHLREKGIGYSIPMTKALHLQPAFAYLGYREGAFPIAEDLAKRTIALPVCPGLKKRQVEVVAETILQFYGVTAG
jgi:dTDP-4-amino-4,6-dideoxygalactose transaminase